MGQSSEHVDDRYSAVRQYSLAEILGVWAAAAVPMGVLAWIVAPWLRDQLGGDQPLAATTVTRSALASGRETFPSTLRSSWVSQARTLRAVPRPN